MIEELDILGTILVSLQNDALQREDVLQYFEKNADLLKNNLESAYYVYKTKSLSELVKINLPKYYENRDLILSNNAEYTVVKTQVIEKVKNAFDDLPKLYLVPCLGLFASNGWAQELDDKYHICLALEFPHKYVDMTLAHEIAHSLNKPRYDTILDGLYNEGFATYISSFLCPGYPEEEYLFNKKDWYGKCLDWLERNKHKIMEDSVQPFIVMEPNHLLYFSGGNKTYPRVGYVIGYEYLKFLGVQYSVEELRNLNHNQSRNASEFQEFLRTYHLA
jgi:hypothetical protein